MTPSLAERKTDLRRRFRAYRASLDEAAYAACSAEIEARCRALPELRTARTVHVYWPLTERREVDTRGLIAWLHAQKKQIVLPKVLSLTKTHRMDERRVPVMEHRRFIGIEDLRPGPWGVQEPNGGAVVPPEALDVVLVPALGADRAGYRIGYGAGYYDAFLATTGALKIGLVYAECLVDALPHEPHDIPLDLLVTEQAVLRTARSGPRPAGGGRSPS